MYATGMLEPFRFFVIAERKNIALLLLGYPIPNWLNKQVVVEYELELS